MGSHRTVHATRESFNYFCRLEVPFMDIFPIGPDSVKHHSMVSLSTNFMQPSKRFLWP